MGSVVLGMGAKIQTNKGAMGWKEVCQMEPTPKEEKEEQVKGNGKGERESLRVSERHTCFASGIATCLSLRKVRN